MKRGMILLAAWAVVLSGSASGWGGERPNLMEAAQKALAALERNPKTLRCEQDDCAHEATGILMLPGRQVSVAVLTTTHLRGGCAMCERLHSFFLYRWQGGRWKLMRAKLAFAEQPFGGVKWSMFEQGGRTLLLQRAFFGRFGRTAEVLSIHDMAKGVPVHVDDFCAHFSNRIALEGESGAKVEDWRAVLRGGKGNGVILEVRDRAAGSRTMSHLALEGNRLVRKGRLDARLLDMEKCYSMF